MKTLQESSFEERSRSVKQRAADLGFDACGIASAGPIDPEDQLGKWIEHGFNADMHWFERTRDLRQDARLKLPGARSVVAVARNYYSQCPETPPHRGRIARYAQGRDYHLVMREPIAALAKAISEIDEGTQCYVSVDTGAVMEKAWAARAGLGWIGKNSLVIREGLGSWFFLGIVITTLELAPDVPVENACRACDKCIKACPTGAIVAPAIVDARRCISYHTVENRGEIPPELRARFGNWVFGCDLCQEACPWNQSASEMATADFLPRAEWADADLDEWLALDEPGFEKRFAESPIRRATHQGILRSARNAKNNLLSQEDSTQSTQPFRM